MSVPAPPSTQPPVSRSPSRLSIIHLLGWITGVAVVLALYRALLESGWLEIPEAGYEEARWWQSAYGLVYGTAISSLGLLVCRRARGDRAFPWHPGHWLLVFGGVAFLIDGIALGIAKGAVFLWRQQIGGDPGWYYIQQSLAWGLASIIAVAVLRQLRQLRTGWNWRLLAVLIATMIGVNFVTHSLVVFELLTQSLGYWIVWSSWPFYMALAARIVLLAVCLAAIPLVIASDRTSRDWLHWVGVVAAILLGVVELCNQLMPVMQRR